MRGKGITAGLRWGGVAILVIAFSLAIAVDLGRVRWEKGNDRFITIVRAEEVRGIPLSAIAEVGVTGIGVRASKLEEGAAMHPAEIRKAGMVPVLILDRAAFPSLIAEGPFPYFWIEGAIGPDDPLLTRLIGSGSVLIRREFQEKSVESALWRGGFRRVVRGHEIPQEELSTLSSVAVTARFVRAVRERGIRALILTPPAGRAQKATLSGFQAVIAAVKREGLSLGRPAALPPDPNPGIGIILHLGVSALCLLLFLEIFPQLPLAGALLAGGLAGLAFGIGDVELRQADAVLLAVAAPAYGSLIFVPRGGIRGGIYYLLGFSGLTLGFSGVLGAILAHPAFIAKVYQFRGVKAALLLPSVLGVLLYLRERRIGLRELFLPERGRPFRVALRTGLVLLALVATCGILIRSGNAPGLTSPLESKTRGLLEALLFARPRFKEFLIGHPLLLLFGTKTGSPWLRAGALFFGLFGQASILNSFSHAHTPLLLSGLRTGNGLMLGAFFGIILYGAVILLQTWRGRR